MVHDAAVAIAAVDEVPRPRRLPADRCPLAAIGLVAPDAGLTAVQQLWQHRTVGDIGWRHDCRVDQFRAAVDAKMRLHAEIPLVALLRLMHLGVARFVGILRRRGCVDDRRIDNCAGGTLQPLGRQLPPDLIEQPAAQIMLFEQMPEPAHRRLVGHRLTPQIDADKSSHRL
jgi:hypothetical protein